MDDFWTARKTAKYLPAGVGFLFSPDPWSGGDRVFVSLTQPQPRLSKRDGANTHDQRSSDVTDCVEAAAGGASSRSGEPRCGGERDGGNESSEDEDGVDVSELDEDTVDPLWVPLSAYNLDPLAVATGHAFAQELSESPLPKEPWVMAVEIKCG